GLVVNLPINGAAGRHTIPAAWGPDLWIAAVLSALLSLPRTAWVCVAGGAFAVGLAAVAVANVGKQQRCATRAEMLWGVVEYLESHAEPGEHVAWVADDSLSRYEGVQLMWHLRNRGRSDCQVTLVDSEGNHIPEFTMPKPTTAPTFWV